MNSVKLKVNCKINLARQLELFFVKLFFSLCRVSRGALKEEKLQIGSYIIHFISNKTREKLKISNLKLVES